MPKQKESFKPRNQPHSRHSTEADILPAEITGSPVYGSLHDALEGRTAVVSASQWEELRALVDGCYPDFSKNLTLILGRMNETELRVCLLIKCGFAPSQIAKLTNKSASAVSSSRIRMAKRALHDGQSAPLWDDFVRAL